MFRKTVNVTVVIAKLWKEHLSLVIYYRNGVTRRCNTLIRIIRHQSKVQILYHATQLQHEMRALSPF